MARVVKEVEFNAKRNEILDVALRLIYTKGYEQMSIQDILDSLKISRGALYHYFDSKHALLEALIDRMGQQAEQALLPIVQDADLSALQKFYRFFEVSARWKTMQRELIVSLLRMWFTDENALIRQKLAIESTRNMSLVLEPIIRQGIREKVFTTQYPQQVAEIIAGIALNLSDAVIGLLLYPQPDYTTIQKLGNILDAFVDTIERTLGAPTGSLKVFKLEDFKDWWSEIQAEPGSK